MALSLRSAGRFWGVLVCKHAKLASRRGSLASLLLVSACAQSPTTDPVLDPSTSDQSERDSGTTRDDTTPTNQNGTGAAAGGSKPGTTPGTSGATTHADAGVPAGSTKDASTPTTPTTPKDAAVPVSSEPKLDASTGSTGGTTPKDAATGPSGTTMKDAATPVVVDAAMPANLAQCASTPGYPTSDACSKCICSKCASQVGQCYASGDATKDMQCAKVQSCAEAKHCASTSCYCGNSALCLAPSGPCVDVITSVVGSTVPLDVSTASDDTSTSVGRAKAIGICSLNSCKSECSL